VSENETSLARQCSSVRQFPIYSTFVYLLVHIRLHADIPQYLRQFTHTGCHGGAVIEHWTGDRKVAGSTPGPGAIKSTRSTQPSIPPGQVNRVPACMAWVKARSVHLCRMAGNAV